MPAHETISDPFLHEPKGVSNAGPNRVYVSDGQGSGSWEKRTEQLSCVIANISTPTVVYIPTLSAGRISRVNVVLQGAITVDDAEITVKDSLGATVATLVVEHDSSATGDQYDSVVAGVNSVEELGVISVETDGGSTTAAALLVVIEVELT